MVMLKELIVSSLLIFCHLLNCQQREYDLISSFLEGHKDYSLYEHFINIPGDISYLEDPERWNDAYNTLDNSQFTDKFDFSKVFSEDDMKSVVSNLKEVRFKDIDKSQIKNTILFIKDPIDKTSRTLRISYPKIINTDKNGIFSFLYAEFLGESDGGLGTIFVYQLIEDKWQLIYKYSIWMS
jgi:hypothetical protein